MGADFVADTARVRVGPPLSDVLRAELGRLDDEFFVAAGRAGRRGHRLHAILEVGSIAASAEGLALRETQQPFHLQREDFSSLLSL